MLATAEGLVSGRSCWAERMPSHTLETPRLRAIRKGGIAGSKWNWTVKRALIPDTNATTRRREEESGGTWGYIPLGGMDQT